MQRRALFSLVAGAATGAMQKPPVAIGFLGASHSHASGKLDVVRASPDYRLIGVCENDPKIQESLAKRGVAWLGREALLKHPEIQVIAVESAVRDHAADGLAVVEAGKHLHLEKAPADNMAAFERVVAAARRNHRLLQVGYMWRYHPGIGKALEAARQGWLGAVYMIRANIGNQLAADRRPEWAEFAGGIMFELGGHLVDPLVRLMGRPRRITPFLHTDGAYADKLKDNTLAVFEWDKAIGIVQGSTLEPNSSRYRTLEIHGTKGCAIVNPIEPPALSIDLETAAGPYAKGAQKIEMPKYSRYVDDFVELAAAVRGEAKLRTSYEEDLLVHEALLRASGMYQEKG